MPAGSGGASTNHKNLGPQPPDQALGRSRGGLSTKIHLACDGYGRPLSVVLTGGQASDTKNLQAVLDGVRVARPVGRPRTTPDGVIADKGYSSRGNRWLLSSRGIKVTIPERDDQKSNRVRRGSGGGRPYAFDSTVYRDRNIVERCFGWIKHWRGIATRFDKNAVNFLGGLMLVSALLWAKSTPHHPGDTT